MKTFVIISGCLLISAAVHAIPADLSISKCTVTAGKGDFSDSITITGLLESAAEHIEGSTEINVKIDCNSISILSQPFPVNNDTFKKGKFKGVVKEGVSTYTFDCDMKSTKFTFTAKKVNLTGLCCPFTLIIEILPTGGAGAVLDEDIVNGAKCCPLPLLMGVADSMKIDKVKLTCGKAPGTDSLTVSGFFTIANKDYDTNHPFCVTSGSQAFAIPGSQFSRKNLVETCNNVVTADGPVISSKLDFNKCTFVVSIKNAVIKDSGDVEFIMDCFGNELSSQISLSNSPRYELERYRCYDVLGRDWTYSADYQVIIDAPDDVEIDSQETGSTTGFVSVANQMTTIDGHECNTVSVSASDSTMYSQWYEDYYGTHQYSWGNAGSDLMGFEANMDFLMAVPKVLPVGQTFKNSGPFTGEFDLGLNDSIDIYDFKGKANISTTLLGFESVTVPYNGNTTFDNAAKVQINLTLNGSMILYIEMYDMRIRTKFQAAMNQTWYGVEDMGVVKCNSDMSMKLTIFGESIYMNMTEEDVLTGYNP